MQTLTRSLFPAYAPCDRALARRAAEFLERGADVRVFLDEGQIGPGEDLLSKARDGRMADTVVVVFSREAMALTTRWGRAQWEGPLVTEPAEEGVRIAFLRADDCVPPKVLQPQFGRRELRRLKRWVRGHAGQQSKAAAAQADVEILGIALADRPGCETVESGAVAREFAREFEQDFDAVLWLDCGERSLAALAGDLGAQLGLHLEGTLSQNLERLREFCEARRFLIVLEDARTAEALELAFRGRSSALISTDAAVAGAPNAIREAQAALRRMGAPWPELCAQARQGRRLLREAGRITELHELMQQWHAAAEARGDRGVADESARELIWILEEWGLAGEARRLDLQRAAEYDDQMMFPFFNNENS